ncbi:hypothetical protein R6Z07F_001487 [Ovis aries]
MVIFMRTDFIALVTVEATMQGAEECVYKISARTAVKSNSSSLDLQAAAPPRWQLNRAGLEKQERRRRGSRGSAARSHVTSFPRSLSCRPPSNQCVPPNDARASWLAFGNACGKAAPTVALLIGSLCRRSSALPERPQAVRSKAPPIGRWVCGWLAEAVSPGPFP